MKEEDIVGKKYGMWTIIGKSDKKIRRALACVCKCECGTIRSVPISSVVKGRSSGCGCKTTKQLIERNISRFKLPEGEALTNFLVNEIKQACKQKKRDFLLSRDFITFISTCNCYYCGELPKTHVSTYMNKESMLKNGIDRFNNNLSYEHGNCVPCCKICNNAKSSLDFKEFKESINNIYLNKSKRSNFKFDFEKILELDLFLLNRKRSSEIGKRGLRLPYGESSFNSAYKMYHERCARDRGLAWDLSISEARFIFESNCWYCLKSPSNVYGLNNPCGKFIYSGIDRIDNSIGYKIGNVVPCCKTCNFAKHTMSLIDFDEWVSKAHAHLIKINGYDEKMIISNTLGTLEMNRSTIRGM